MWSLEVSVCLLPLLSTISWKTSLSVASGQNGYELPPGPAALCLRILVSGEEGGKEVHLSLLLVSFPEEGAWPIRRKEMLDYLGL